MKTKLLIIIGIIIAITISVSALIIIDNIERESTVRPTTIYETDQQYEIVMNHCINGNQLDNDIDQSYFNSTHYIWTGECEWILLNDPAAFSHAISLTEQYYYLSPYYFEGQTDDFEIQYEIIEKISIMMPTFEENRNEIQQVLDYCENKPRTHYEILYNYSNDTHSINTKTCEWKEHGTFPNTDNLCIPYSDQWFTGEEIRNQTHIFIKDSCTWKIDQEYDTVNSKGCPQFCPKDGFENDTSNELLFEEKK